MRVKRLMRQRSSWLGPLVIAGVVTARLTGGLQFLELVALDHLLRSRPTESSDDRIVIVGITEADIQQARTYPIPDGTLADLIQQLQSYQPAVIGLDVVRDQPVEPGHAALTSVFRTHKTVIGAEVALPDRNGFTVAPPPALPPEQVGFVDTVLDEDGYQRRSLLGTHNPQRDYRFSFTMRVAAAYLATQGFDLENGRRDPIAMRFGEVELTRFQPRMGGYVNANADGNQILLNVRSRQHPFRMLSVAEIREKRVNPDWIRGRIVLIGVTSFSVKDLASSGAIVGINPGQIFGVEIQAHAISQITSAVLDRRPLLNAWAEGWEYLWIVAWGIVSLSLGHVLHSPWKIVLGLGVTLVSVLITGYVAILLGWWLTVVPVLLILVLNGVGLAATSFYRHEQELQLRLEERQFVIQQVFDAIHSKPLQRLSSILKAEQEKQTAISLLPELEQIRREFYDIFGTAQRQVFDAAGNLSIGGEIGFALQAPIHELLYKMYSNTLERDLPYLNGIKFKVVQFDPLDDRYLRLEHKWALCRFLEEALCNVGKYAAGATQLTVLCTQDGNRQVIRVIDNGAGLPAEKENGKEQKSKAVPSSQTHHSGMGTQLAKNLAKQLGGTFRRYPNQPNGTVCELTWSISSNPLWRFMRRFLSNSV